MKSTHPHPRPRLVPKSTKPPTNNTQDDRPAVEYASTLYLPPDNTKVENQADKEEEEGEEKKITCPYELLTKEVQDFLLTKRGVLEEKMFEAFYMMRIEQSKRFIDLTDKINKSWEDFVDYLKSIASLGASGDGDCTVYSITNSTSLTALSQLSND